MKRLLPAALLLLWCVVPACAQNLSDAERYYQRKSLDGVANFEVVVAPFGVVPGLSLKDIERSTRARLKDKGLPALPFAEASAASLAVRLVAFFDQRLKVWAVAFTIELLQQGAVARTKEITYGATWRRMGVVITDGSFRELRSALGQILNEFAEDWLIANP